MRNFIVTLCCVLPLWGIAQNPEIKNELPNVIPPAPTVAALMKFEEIPVSNYTGVPDITIPLYSIPTKSNKLNLSVALKYHPLITADEMASDTGLGWSLLAGGTISRTVRGLPDEQLILASGNHNQGKVGIYHHDYTNHKNNYYYLTSNYQFEDQNDIYFNNSMSLADTELWNEFIWSTREIGRYDTEHDLWQFNFMGKTGRFYIKKNIITNTFEVIPLDDYRLKINYIQTTEGINNYIPSQFEIIDENGLRYIFNVIEKSLITNATNKLFSSVNSNSQSITPGREHISAIHLKEVYDPNNNLILSFNYSEGSKECYKITSITSNDTNDLNYLSYAATTNCLNEFPPILMYTSTFNATDVKKLSSIEISGIGNLFFEFENGRNDTNIALQGTAKFLKSIYFEALNQSPFTNSNTILQTYLIKKYEFNYSYSELLNKRMMLDRISVINRINSVENYYLFKYKKNIIPYGYNVGKDYWGFPNLFEECRIDNRYFKNTTPEFCTSDVIQKIKYPTDGSVVFDFESNTYSFEGNLELNDFSENPNNYIFNNSDTFEFTNTSTINSVYNSITNPNGSIYALNFSNSTAQKVSITSDAILPSDMNNAQVRLCLMKFENNTWHYLESLNCSENMVNCCFDFILSPGIQYGLKRDVFTTGFQVSNNTVDIKYYYPNNHPELFNYGGGIRIKQIGYFTSNVDENYFQNNNLNILPSKLVKYSYQLASNILKSSGSLVYKKPVYSCNFNFVFNTNCNPMEQLKNGSVNYTSHRSTNFLEPIKTQGSDVGYQDVRVYEDDNGYTDYFYSSPVMYPETISDAIANHISSVNIDYKRGNLLEKKVFHKNDRLLSDEIYSYDFTEFSERTGLLIYRDNNDPYFQGSFFSNYAALRNQYELNLDIYSSSPTQTLNSSVVLITSVYLGNNVNYLFSSNASSYTLISPIAFHCGNPMEQKNFLIKPVIKNYGWAKLEAKVTKNYFYDANNNQSEVVTHEFFQYNPLNKMIAEHKVINSLGEETKTTYNYLTDPAALVQNRIAEIEEIQVEKEGAPISQSKIVYSNTFAGNTNIHLPSVIQTAKGGLALENKIRYNQYDTYGNPLEVQQENGMLISYIYGYHNTQVVAKIENLGYNSIPTNLITAIQNATDAATYSESAVLNALDHLRNDSALANSMVTTVTHIPLVGVSTMTTPNGIRMQYHYDSMNRLEKVTDHKGNIVTENSYNYRP